MFSSQQWIYDQNHLFKMIKVARSFRNWFVEEEGGGGVRIESILWST